MSSTCSPEHTPLQPDWLSRHSVATPARCRTCSTDWWPRMAFSSYCARPYGENMHGSETSVLLPQAVTRGKFSTPRRASSGVVCLA